MSGGEQTFGITSNVSWTVSSSASWLTVSPTSGSNSGTVTLTASANSGSNARTATVTVSGAGVSNQTVTVTQEAQGIVVQPTPPSDSQGSIDVSLNVPVNEPFALSFTIALPAGFNLNQVATALISELLSSHQLTISPAGAGHWLFEIKPKTSLRSANEMTYQQVVHIVYTLDETVTAGDYEVTVSDINLTLSNSGTTVHQDEIRVPVTVDGPTGIESVGASQIWFYRGILHVNTPVSERIDVYSVSGLRLYTAQKLEGEARFNLGGLPRGILIVRGGSGWARKIKN
jgi:hypothetical protein